MDWCGRKACRRGAPLVGDSLYGGRPSETRLLLHARSVALRHPATGAPLHIEAPPPEDFVAAMHTLGLVPP